LLSKNPTTEDTDTNGGHGQLVHAKTTNAILSSAYRVHSRLGPGLLERPYRCRLAYEIRRLGLRVETEKVLPIVYDALTIEFGYRIDLPVDDVVIVEVKAVDKLAPVHEARLLSYLKLSRTRVGLLINFNVTHVRDGIRRSICGF
jgi:GxxExxY protein